MGRKRKDGILIDSVVELIIRQDYISTPFIQRKFQISYAGAQRILKQLAEMGYIGKVTEFKPVKVIRHKFIE